MIIFEPTIDDIREAQRIRRQEDKTPGNRDFSPYRWAGKLAEKYFPWHYNTLFDLMLPITQHYDATKVDFKSSMTHKHYELKTKIGTHPTHKNRWFDLNMKQYEENPCDIYVAFYYDREQNELAMANGLAKRSLVSYLKGRSDQGIVKERM